MSKESEYTDPEKSGLRSGKGLGLISKLILNIKNKEFDKEDINDSDKYSNPKDTGIRSGKGNGIFSKTF